MIWQSTNTALDKFDIYCFITHDNSAVFLPLLSATSSGDSIERSALMVALTTFTGLVDLPGNILTTITLALYPTMKRIGGYPLIFRVYALMMFGTAICEYEFHRLESINPTVESPFD